jgi:TonB family protein
MKTNFITLCWVVILLADLPSTGQQAAEITRAKADEHLVKRVEPDYPPIAKTVRLQGKVVLKVTISKDGAVTAARIVSGHPMLAPAAVQAVKQWRYKPFIVDGRAMEITTVIEVPFSLGISEANYRKEQEVEDRYFKQQEKCRELLQQRRYPDAEQTCTPLIELAAQMPAERRLERLTAYQYVGHADLGQQRFADALVFYKQELAIAEVALKPLDAELAYAYRDVARGLHGIGDLTQARSYYEHAVSTLEQARNNMDSAFLKNEYSRTMKSVLREYAVLLRQMGDTPGADAAEQRAKSIED